MHDLCPLSVLRRASQAPVAYILLVGVCCRLGNHSIKILRIEQNIWASDSVNLQIAERKIDNGFLLNKISIIEQNMGEEKLMNSKLLKPKLKLIFQKWLFYVGFCIKGFVCVFEGKTVGEFE